MYTWSGTANGVLYANSIGIVFAEFVTDPPGPIGS